MTYDDNYFFENNYWTKHYEETSSHKYLIIGKTEKWKELVETCLRTTRKDVTINGINLTNHQIITMNILNDVINGETHRNPKKNHYTKISRPEGYLTVKQRQDKVKRRKSGNANRRLK